MKDQREEILRIRKDYVNALGKVGKLEAVFISTGCRYRNDNDTCGHPRHNMKKYPQHQPGPVLCEPNVCPRN